MEAAGNDEEDLRARAAWLHFIGRMTHADVADTLHIPAFKVQRLIARATRDGVVQVFVNSPVAECVRLERVLCGAFGLAECLVAPTLGGKNTPLAAIATAGAQYVHRVLQEAAHPIIGLGHGRTLAALVEHLPRSQAPQVSFVALLGGLTTSFSADPYDVIHSISGRTGAQGFFLPVPFFANSAADRAVLLSQVGVMEVQALARRASLLLVGIGTATRDGFLARNGSVAADDLGELARLGASGELLGYFFDQHGGRVETAVSQRSITLDYDQLDGRNMVAVAGGPDKIEALLSVLRTGFLQGLITDEETARTLAARASEAGTAPPRRASPPTAVRRPRAAGLEASRRGRAAAVVP